jgi:uncharacterized protein YecE (DUF72 family)
MDAVIAIGTSGFQYDDWVGPFYPESLPKWEWLSFYAREFGACELNFTYYRIPTAKTLTQMSAKVPAGFLFAVKAFQGITHEREGNDAAFPEFAQSLEPLRGSGQLGCVLLQFPYSFGNTAQNHDYLKLCRDRLSVLPLVVEFRKEDWIQPQVFDLLRKMEMGFCCVDEPRIPRLMPPIAEATSKIAYVRFHGRNAKKWWNHEQAWERYDYAYSADELQEWVPKIRQLDSVAETTFVFANNHWQAKAVDTARQLRLLLGQDAAQ